MVAHVPTLRGSSAESVKAAIERDFGYAGKAGDGSAMSTRLAPLWRTGDIDVLATTLAEETRDELSR